LHTSCDLLILVEQSAEPAWRASQIPAMLLDRLVLCARVRVHQLGFTADAAGRCRERPWARGGSAGCGRLQVKVVGSA
jgi:hypothetical protein